MYSFFIESLRYASSTRFQLILLAPRQKTLLSMSLHVVQSQSVFTQNCSSAPGVCSCASVSVFAPRKLFPLREFSKENLISIAEVIHCTICKSLRL